MKKTILAMALSLMCAVISWAENPTSQNVKCGQTVRLTPQPAPGYEFSHWQDDPTNKQNPRLVTIGESTTLTDFVAVFVQSTYTVSAAAKDPTMGSVSVASQSGHLGDKVTFTATAASQCYVFDHWENEEGLTIGNTASIEVEISKTETIYAVFVEANITITATGTNGSVTIEVVE